MAIDNPLMHALARRIGMTVTETGRCLITSPVELAPLKGLSANELRAFSADHGWTAVPRLGFSQVEFFAVHLPRTRAGLV